jgi:hypothetical protein
MTDAPEDQARLLADVYEAAAAAGDAREKLRTAVLAALRAHAKQRDLADASGWTREYLRRLAREAGIQPTRSRTREGHTHRGLDDDPA